MVIDAWAGSIFGFGPDDLPSYILEEEEGHGFFHDEQRWLSLRKNIDDFLARHIGDKR